MNFFDRATTTIDPKTMEETPFDELRSLGYRADEFDLNAYPSSTCPWHWHNELEFFFMRKGTIEYGTPGRKYRFCEGDAGFVNANILHMSTVPAHTDAVQQYHIFPLKLIAIPHNGIVEQAYIEPLVHNSAADVICFPAGSAVAAAMREEMERAYKIYTEKPSGMR